MRLETKMTYFYDQEDQVALLKVSTSLSLIMPVENESRSFQEQFIDRPVHLVKT